MFNLIKKEENNMQTNKKPNIALEAFDMAKSIQDVSRSGSLYGKLFAIKDMQLHLLQEDKKLNEQIAEQEKK